MKLTENRWVHAIWCDDIRQEIGNKPSLMGVYTGSLVAPALPAVLPRLAVWVSIYTPITQPFESLSVRICKNDSDEPVGAIEISPEGLAEINQPIQRLEGPNEPTLRGISMVILLGQFQLSESTRSLKVWVDTEAGTLESLKLRIEPPPLQTDFRVK